MSKKLIIDWDTYNKSIDNLAVQISDSGFKPSFIICIARGGLRVGDILSRIFNVKCGYLGVESCLLYTSPSPRDRTRSRMPSSA